MDDLIKKISTGEIIHSFIWKGSTCDIYIRHLYEGNVEVCCNANGCILDGLYVSFRTKLIILGGFDHKHLLMWLEKECTFIVKRFIDNW